MAKIKYSMYITERQKQFIKIRLLTRNVNPLSSFPNFLFSTNQTLFDFFLKGGEKRIKSECTEKSSKIGKSWPQLKT